MKKIELACIIDDDPIFVYGTKKLMELSEVCSNFMLFENGDVALKALKPMILGHEQLPEVILLDLNMPVMDGWQFLDELIKIDPPRELHIYIVSSSIDPADVKRASSYNLVNKYVVKPITLSDIRALMVNE